MAKRITKADQILSEARERVVAANAVVDARRMAAAELNAAVEVAAAALRAHVAAYEALKAALTPKPRKKSEKADKGAPAQKELPKPDKKTSGALCVANVPILNVPCGDPEDHLIHSSSGGYAGYHPFEAPKPVARAPRKSRQKPEEQSVTQNLEIVKDAATSAARAASEGD